MPKKNISVADLLEFANNLNKRFSGETPEDFHFRNGVNAMIEHALFATDNYNGYCEDESKVKPGEPDLSSRLPNMPFKALQGFTARTYAPNKTTRDEYQKLAEARRNGNGYH